MLNYNKARNCLKLILQGEKNMSNQEKSVVSVSREAEEIFSERDKVSVFKLLFQDRRNKRKTKM